MPMRPILSINFIRISLFMLMPFLLFSFANAAENADSIIGKQAVNDDGGKSASSAAPVVAGQAVVDKKENAPERDKAILEYNKGYANFGGSANSESRNPKSDDSGVKPGRFGAELLTYMVLLGAILWGCLYAAKRFIPGGKQLFACPSMEVLGRTHLDPRRYLALVRVGRKILVIGVTQDTLSPLSEINDEAEVAEIFSQAKPKSEVGASVFQKLFSSQVERVEKDATAQVKNDAAERLENEISELRERVKALSDSERQ